MTNRPAVHDAATGHRPAVHGAATGHRMAVHDAAVGYRMDSTTRYGALASLLAGALALGVTGLLAPQVCLLTLILICAVGGPAPHRIAWLVDDTPQRTVVALLALALLVLATARSGPAALTSGGLKGDLGLAATELALPTAVPIGLLAALAAGALVAVGLELSDRRGVQSALVLGIAVLGLASVAAPGWHLLPVILLGWPAALFTLTRLASADDPALVQLSASGDRLPPRSVRNLARWHLLPVLAAIAVGGAVLLGAVLTGLVTSAGAPGGADAIHAASGSATGRATSDYLGGELDLSARGPLGTEAFLQVPADSPRLWRAGTLDYYTGHGWLTTLPPAGLPELHADAPDELTVVPRTATSGSATSTASTTSPDSSGSPGSADPVPTYEVRPLRRGQAEVLAPGQLVSLTSSSLVGSSAFGTAGDRVTVEGAVGGLGRYQVRSRVLPVVDDPAVAPRLLAAGRGTQPDTSAEGQDPRWTALPRSVPERVRQLGIRLVTGAPSRLAAVQAVERELDRRMTYNLDSPTPPAGVDAVDDVLFTSHSGFCEQFASAEVVLLRSAGVPARMAVGFAGDQPATGGSLRTLHRSDAHAWVEVWFPGVGWASSDPTPAAPVSSSWWHSVRQAFRSLLGARLTWLAAVLVALVLGIPLLVGGFRRERSEGEPADVRRLDPDLATAFARLEADLARRGQGRAANETVAALARRLAGPTPGELQQALAVLEQAMYGPQPPTRAESVAAAATIHRSLAPVSSQA